MKLIAHRGGMLGKENSLDTLIASARLGADAVECDLRRTKDGQYVIFHDPTLERLTGVPAALSELTLAEMEQHLAASGLSLLTFDELRDGYRESAPILLHIKQEEALPSLASMVAGSGLPLIAGVVSLPMLRCFTPLLPPERLLAFMPERGVYRDYYAQGAGIIRLWEHWLPLVKPADVKAACPGARVFIMASSLTEPSPTHIPLEAMDGSAAGLERCAALGADGVLLNDIGAAIAWRNR